MRPQPQPTTPPTTTDSEEVHSRVCAEIGDTKREATTGSAAVDELDVSFTREDF